ncbi:ATP-binding protein [Methylophaga nitratireducenticrescens]|uniref:histidine kinase n=1 Tax=Methylophaga nitratireducenticrescens TaxID=754476 RepID=I1XFU4_METNJ|nr:ATP-binding protein [Methylophaga nitratireducenticrescens]AFI83263.1 ATP-binding protein [Methylophaga nitratireducenticrescens]AUZ83392.1 ATP-binding protein [Methylophaga nitratireducenticrescens]
MNSLKRRLSIGLTFTLSLLILLQWALITLVIERVTETQLLERLENESEGLLASVEVNPDGSFYLSSLRLSSLYQRPFSGHYYVVCSVASCKQSRSLWDESLKIEQLSSGQKIQSLLNGPNEERLFSLQRGYFKQGHSLTIMVGQNISELEEDIFQFQMLYSLVSAIGLFVLLLIQWLIVGKALQPLQHIQQQLSRLRRGETEAIEAQGPEEIQPMVEELNRLLKTMTRKTHRSRAALGNLAHALKTRLTLLNQTAESSELKGMPETQNALHQVSQHMEQIIERELKRARLLGASMPGKKVDLEQEIAEISRTLQLLYRDKSPIIDWEIEAGLLFFGDREDLLEMLGNLLENACKWCRKRINIHVYQNQYCCFVVEDDGQGCDESKMSQLPQRGFRADESVPGSGLGLAIVSDIVESYGGEIRFSQSSMGGLKVEVRLLLTV